MSETLTAGAAAPDPDSARRNPPGSFIWYELLTSDVQGAAEFYGKVLHWTVRDAGVGGDTPYYLLSANGVAVGGLMALPAGAAQAGMRPGWLGYIGVDDVDRATAQAQAAGATVHMPPTDIPGVGRFAMLADPQGAPFYIMRGGSEEPSAAYRPDVEGHAMWNELATSDAAAAFAFYAALFGWEKGEAMPMGEAGDYQFLTCDGQTFGALMNLPPTRSRAGWTYCFRVADIDAARERVGAAGGTPTEEPVEVPGGIWVFEALDPQGARFYLGGPRKP